MKKHAKQLLKHPLIKGSAIMITGNLIANFFNFLFNLFMSRNLSIADYGVLASITSLISLPWLFVGSLSPMVINFAGEYFAKFRLDLARGLYIKITKLFLIIIVILSGLFLIFLNQISEFFHIYDKNILILTLVIIDITIISQVNNFFIQAKLLFNFQVSLNILIAILKLLTGIILVFLGYSVGGAVFAIFLSFFLGFFYTFIPLKFIFTRKAGIPHVSTKDLITYGFPSALSQLGLASFITADIILVKHFFPPELAGIYAGLSLVGKVIFYISSPIGGVMFPLIIQKYNRQENTTGTFILSFILVLGSSFFICVFYFLFPNFTMLLFLKKTEYLVVSNLLGIYGIFISLYSLVSIMANFYLSINKTNIMYPLLFGAIFQVVLITLYHQNFIQIILSSLFVTLAVLVVLLIYYPFALKNPTPQKFSL